MDKKYQKTKFDEYLFRFKIRLHTKERSYCIDIYSNTDSIVSLNEMIRDKSSEKVTGWSIMSVTSKEEDDMISNFLDTLD